MSKDLRVLRKFPEFAIMAYPTHIYVSVLHLGDRCSGVVTLRRRTNIGTRFVQGTLVVALSRSPIVLIEISLPNKKLKSKTKLKLK